MSFDEKNQIVILKDTTYDDVFALVEFMYRGEINVAQVSTHFFSWYLFFFFEIVKFSSKWEKDHPASRIWLFCSAFVKFILYRSEINVAQVWLYPWEKTYKKTQIFCCMCTLIIRHLLTDNFTLLKYVCKYCFLLCLASKEC